MRCSQTALAVHAFVRAPSYRAIPAANAAGVTVSRDLLNYQFRDFYRVLQQSTLIDKVHLMSERAGGVECLRVADMMACVGPTLLEMPLTGMEHRAMEFLDTSRYIRAAGGPSTAASFLRDKEGCRCHSGDIVSLPNGIAVAHGPRTNSIAHDVLRALFEVQPTKHDDAGGTDRAGDGVAAVAHDEADSSYYTGALGQYRVYTLEQEADAPPLGDYFAFAGVRTLVAWKDEHGLLAVDQYQQLVEQEQARAAKDSAAASDEPLNVIYLEPGCHFLTFYGVDTTTDVLVQKGYERSMDTLAAAGLNPIPVAWTEMDKIDVSMRSAVLPLTFFQNNTAGMLTRNKAPRAGRWQSHQIQ